MVQKLFKHYQKVNRDYGVPAYKIGCNIFFFGEEKDKMKKAYPNFLDKFYFDHPNLMPKLSDFVKTDGNIEYFVIHYTWLTQKIRNLFGHHLNVIAWEEVQYGFFSNVSD